MPGIDWQVTNQRMTERLVPGGQFVKGVLVNVLTSRGTTAEFFVPDPQYNVEYVRALVQEWVDRESAIHSLTG